MSLHIRPYLPADLPLLKQITAEAFEPVSIERNIEREFGIVNGHDWRWRKGRQIEQDVARCFDGIFVAEVDGQVVGYITTWMDHEAGVGFIPNLAVTASMRGRGIGRSLIEHSLNHFRRLEARLVRIETLEQNPIGQQLYPDVGFREVARQIHYCLELKPDPPGST